MWAVDYRRIVSYPTLAEVRAYLAGDEGALLDAYAESHGLDGWQHVLNAVECLDWPKVYTEDGNAAQMPADAGAILDRSSQIGCLLQISSPAGLRINCSFFDPDEIEFDFDPREFTDQSHVDDMCRFISAVGKAQTAAVNVGIESASSPRPDALLTYEPTEDRVVVHDWRRGRLM